MGDARVRVLIVEDDPAMRATLAKVLARETHARRIDAEIATAASCEEACALFESEGFDALLVDVRLGAEGDRSGFELLRRVRKVDRDVPAIVLTGIFDYEVEREAEELGGTYVPKERLDAHHLSGRVLGAACAFHAAAARPSGTMVRVDDRGLGAALGGARAEIVLDEVERVNGT